MSLVPALKPAPEKSQPPSLPGVRPPPLGVPSQPTCMLRSLTKWNLFPSPAPPPPFLPLTAQTLDQVVSTLDGRLAQSLVTALKNRWG